MTNHVINTIMTAPISETERTVLLEITRFMDADGTASSTTPNLLKATGAGVSDIEKAIHGLRSKQILMHVDHPNWGGRLNFKVNLELLKEGWA